MKWEGRDQSTNVEDRRGMRGPAAAAGGGGLLLIVIVIVMKLIGADPQQQQAVVNIAKNVQQRAAQAPPAEAGEGFDDKSREFIAVILHDTETIWTKLFREQISEVSYTPPKVIMFTDSVASGCGNASAAMGPFYCPGDQKLYLDFAFFRELKNEFKAPGDFAQAYVIAHEVGHHVQNLLGTMNKVQGSRNSNEMSVRLELQADCYAGIYANYAQKKGILEAGDTEEALRAASAVGDDTIQRRTQGSVVPDSFTHGSSQQRIEWFAKGFKTGDMRQCNTFER